MYVISAVPKNMKKYSVKGHRGFVTIYFLGILLYISAVSTAVLANECARMKTIENLQKDSHYFIQERKAIEQVKCVLKEENWQDEPEKWDEIMEIHGATGYIDIQGEYPELLILTFNLEQTQILDYESIKYW